MKIRTYFPLLFACCLVLTLVTIIPAAKKPADGDLLINRSLLNLQVPGHESFLLFWEQVGKHGSDLYYKHIFDNNIQNSKKFSKVKNINQEIAADYLPDYGLYITFTQVQSGISDIIVIGRREVPDLLDKKIRLKPVGDDVHFLPPGDSTDFKKAVRLTEGTARISSPDVAAGVNGAHLVWVSQTPGDSSSSGIFYRYIGTDTSSEIIPVSLPDRLIDSDPEIARSSDGVVHIFWSAQTPDGDYDIMHSYSIPSGGFSPELPVEPSPYNDIHPSAAADNDGVIYLAWETGDLDNRDVAGVYFQSGAVIHLEVHPANDANDTNPALTVDPCSGLPMIAWQNDEEGSICVMATEFCAPGSICMVTTPGPWEDLHPSIAASLTDSVPTVSWCRYLTTNESKILIKGPRFSDDEEIE